MSEEIKKCQFCTSEATTVYRAFVSTRPDVSPGVISYDYYGEAVYACDKHALSCQGFLLNGEDDEGEAG